MRRHMPRAVNNIVIRWKGHKILKHDKIAKTQAFGLAWRPAYNGVDAVHAHIDPLSPHPWL